ncbi:MAG: MBL fold metallo-hydrolase [Pirellulaceae bacterium]|nr:MBL fold metallo-hydrolase [Pirellulaceae bacterium]
MLNIYTIPVTPFAQNARVLHDPDTNWVTIVDPGGEIERIMAQVRQLEPQQLNVLLTHAHIDHAGGAAYCLQLARQEFSLPVPLYAHRESILRGSIRAQAHMFGLTGREYQDVPDPDVTLDDGDVFAVGGYSANVLFTPGHAPDHLSLYFDVQQVQLHESGRSQYASAPVVIAGDALFAGSIGRTDLPGGSLPLLIKSITEKLFTLPDDTLVLSGHGPQTTIGEERRYNPFLKG